jgi:tRNA A-37 threonylcarbamoyl transferase component Bud32
MSFEARALHEVSLLLRSESSEAVVEPAQYIGYDPNQHVLHISDGGSTHLKNAYISNLSLDIPKVGQQIGSWLGRLHNSTTKMDIGDNQTAKYIYRHAYNNLSRALKQYDHDATLGDQINDEFGSLLQTDDLCVCHGDFWPGNVLVKTDPMKLTIVDWEMTRRGNGATDVGQFSAEAYLLDHFHGTKGLRESFLKGYMAEKSQGWSLEDARRVAIHFGTHLAFWPTRVQWGRIDGNNSTTRECVELGKQYLERARDGDWDWLKRSELSILFDHA